MDTREVAELAGVDFATLRSWFARGLAHREASELAEGAGKPCKIGPRSAGKIVAMGALVKIGFTASAASALIYGENCNG